MNCFTLMRCAFYGLVGLSLAKMNILVADTRYWVFVGQVVVIDVMAQLGTRYKVLSEIENTKNN